ncbi:hypothetical protein Ciccas_013092, partial [Cichlidogyrus casuarinus]
VSVYIQRMKSTAVSAGADGSTSNTPPDSPADEVPWSFVGNTYTDQRGHVSFEFAPENQAQIGIHLVKLQPKNDASQSIYLTLSVVAPGTECVVFSIDGSFLAGPSLRGRVKLKVHCAYGSSKDVPIYKTLGLTVSNIFTIGSTSSSKMRMTTRIRHYNNHLNALMNSDLGGLVRPACAVNNVLTVTSKAPFTLTFKRTNERQIEMY